MNIIERKKVFDDFFVQKVVPLFAIYGFLRHTKTSKRFFKEYKNELSVIISIEFNNFGSGFYEPTIVYFDQEIGNFNNDFYLAIANLKKPIIRTSDLNIFKTSTVLFLNEIEAIIIPFIEANSTHKAILNSKEFYFSPSKESEIKTLLKRKSR